MSRNSLRYNYHENRYSIKIIMALFLMMDAPLLPLAIEHFFLDHLFWLIATQGSMVLGLIVGTKGRGKVRAFMFELRATINDPKYDDHEELRGHILKQQIRNACLEYDAWFFRQDQKTRRKSDKNKTIRRRSNGILG